jgi:zinc/manganese transport system substrate-binding protein
MRLRIILAPLAILLLGVATGCGGQAAGSGSKLGVVAAENAYGDMVSQIGGSHVSVNSILSDPNADPHLYEPGTRNGLAVAQARLVIQNGAGYDAFMQRLEDASPSSHRLVVTVADVLGVHGKNANPHLWYDVPRLGTIAAAITSGLERADPAHAADYCSGLRRFDTSLSPLRRQVARIKASFAGSPVATTEPVPGYLLAAAGLKDVAPGTFTRAIEDGTEPTPQAVAAMDALMTGRRVKVLLYNSQAVSPITSRIRSAAVGAGIPVVGVTETLPPNLTFQQWQLAQAQQLDRALSR